VGRSIRLVVDMAHAPPRRHLAALGDGRRQPARGPQRRGLVLNTRDVSDRKKLEAKLVHQAFHDGLTGLANRTLFAERVELAVLFIDLDDFKHVNDSLGHAAGDQLLIAAARRLQGCLRPTDTAARLGGDEFAVLLERVTDAEAAAVAGPVLDTLHQPFGLNGRTIPIKASLGVATGLPGADEAEELLRNADVAMYAAKAEGKDRSELFRPDSTRTCSSAWSWRPNCATWPTETSSCCTTSRSSSSSRAASPGSRRLSAGTPDQGPAAAAGLHPPCREAGADRTDRQLGCCSRHACRRGAGRTGSRTRRRCRSTPTCPAASSRSSAWSARSCRRWRCPGCRRACSPWRSPRASW
jgi:diguanylate cyclase (GGDEF)-like protein